MTGRLIGIARKAKRRAPMEELERAQISAKAGIEGDHGPRPAKRVITLLSREAFDNALTEIDAPADTSWTLRRANLCVEGIELPQAPGVRLRIGEVLLETTYETDPCGRMDEQLPGLRKALEPDWRGGVRARVLEEGEIALGDPVVIEAVDDTRSDAGA
jgi:MOSC domain-containing protein YiiM